MKENVKYQMALCIANIHITFDNASHVLLCETTSQFPAHALAKRKPDGTLFFVAYDYT